MAETPTVEPNGTATNVAASPVNGRSSAPGSPAAHTIDTPEQMSNAEKKKQAKAEKAARRAKAKEEQAAASNVSSNIPAPQEPSSQSRSQKDSGKQPQSNIQHRRTSSISSAAPPKSLPVRRRPSQSVPKEQPAQENKPITFFSHLHGQPRRRVLEGTPKDIHPAISALSLQQSSYTVCGSHARCVAMLLALKAVISSYTTPHGTSLPRHLVSHHLSPQLAHLKSSRPFSISQANAIRWLKNLIATIDPSLAEDEAKTYVTTSIDTFIRDKFTVADQVIAEAASERITDGDVVITFGKSAVVQSTLMRAIERGTKFQVVVVDSRPLHEGKHLARYLSPHVQVTYAFITGLGRAVQDATKCFLGAHAIYANGRLQSRAGTALVAMAAKSCKIPVIVCTESIKLTDRIAIDSIVGNELGPEEELLSEPLHPPVEANAKSTDSKANNSKQGSGSKDSQDKSSSKLQSKGSQGLISDPAPTKGSQSKWQETENLQLLNALFDVTPAENIDIIVTELGSFPPISTPVVQRISSGA